MEIPADEVLAVGVFQFLDGLAIATERHLGAVGLLSGSVAHILGYALRVVGILHVSRSP